MIYYCRVITQLAWMPITVAQKYAVPLIWYSLAVTATSIQLRLCSLMAMYVEQLHKDTKNSNG